MSQRTYRTERDRKNLEYVELLIKDMPYFVKDYIVALKEENKSSATILSYARDLHTFFDYLANSAGFSKADIRKCSVDMLDLLNIKDLREFVASRDYNPNGRARMISTLKGFYKFYAETGDIKTNPASLFKKTSIPKKEITTLTPKEISQLIEAVETPDTPGKPLNKRRALTQSRDKAILLTLLGTGIRVSELVGLDKDDVDMVDMCLHIVRKGGNEDRVFFGKEVKEAIESYWEDDRDSLEPDEASTDALFISYNHSRLTVRSVEEMVKKYSKKACIGKHVTPHKFRSTYGTHVYEETGDIYLVASALGHSSVETTQKRYARQSDKNKMKAAVVSSSLFSESD